MTDSQNALPEPNDTAGLIDALGCVVDIQPGDIPYSAVVLVACSSDLGETVLRHGTSYDLDYFALRGILAEAVDNTTGWAT